MSPETCRRKRRFETRDQAQKFAANIRKRGMAAQKAYHCPYCSGWHLTTKRTPVEVPAPPPPPGIGKRTAVTIAKELVDGADQRMRYDDRVVVDLPVVAWDRLVELRRASE